jgi:hypothetical protein
MALVSKRVSFVYAAFLFCVLALSYFLYIYGAGFLPSLLLLTECNCKVIGLLETVKLWIVLNRAFVNESVFVRDRESSCT